MNRSIVTAFFVLLAVPLYAQDGPTEFFEEGFVEKGTSQEETEMEPSLRPGGELIRPEPGEDKSGLNLLEGTEVTEGRDEQESDEHLPTAVEGEESVEVLSDSNLAVRQIDLVVSSSKLDELRFTFEQYLKLLKEHKYRPGVIEIHGDTPKNQKYAKYWVPLVSRGVKLGIESGRARELGLTLSPSWILDTPEGVIVLEGVKSLDSYLDSEGRLRGDLF